MAITPSSSNPLDPQIVEVETSCRGGVEVSGLSGMLQLRASDGVSVMHQDFNKNTSGQVQRYKKRIRTKSDDSESLSDIDDAEISGYLNNNEEMHLKRILWEAMNRDQVKAKKQKQATETKKNTSTQKAAKTTKKPEHPKRSSRINYDALKILNDELELGSEMAHNIDLESDSRGNDNSRDKSMTPVMHGSEEGNYSDEDDGIFGNQVVHCLMDMKMNTTKKI